MASKMTALSIIGFFLFFASIKAKIVDSHYCKTDGKLEIKMYFKGTVHPKNILLDLQSNYSFISEDFFDESIECLNKKEVQIYEEPEHKINAISCTGEATLLKEKNYVYDFNFYLITLRTQLSYSYHLALGLIFENENYSFIHLLYRQGTIENLQFWLIPEKRYNRRTGTIYFGGVPDFIFSQIRKKGVCSVAGKRNWSCDMSKIAIKNYEYINTYETLFNPSVKEIYAPKDFIVFLSQTVFADSFLEDKCSVELLKGNKGIVCDKEVLDKYTEISFVMGKYQYVFKLKSFFECVQLVCEGIIYENRKNEWVFGSQFLEYFYSSFDYEEKSISFCAYEDSEVKIVEVKDGGELKVFFFMNVIILVFGTLINSIFKKNLRI